MNVVKGISGLPPILYSRWGTVRRSKFRHFKVGIICHEKESWLCSWIITALWQGTRIPRGFQATVK